MESQKMHSRHVMLHCFKKGNSAKDTADEIFTVYGSGTNWFKKFGAGNFELKDEDRSGRPATTDTDIIKIVLTENPRYSVREIVDATDIPKTTVHEHLIKIGYANRCEVWVPHLLTETGLMNRVSTKTRTKDNCSQKMRERLEFQRLKSRISDGRSEQSRPRKGSKRVGGQTGMILFLSEFEASNTRPEVTHPLFSTPNCTFCNYFTLSMIGYVLVLLAIPRVRATVFGPESAEYIEYARCTL
ncbi:Histone-lysine N-methyltransferase SETMAR [Melipona quadrifasciata]|uniref:Histone-lysine N-methyltransferase SETMAR n=1 Tax=Melipona quadrifasciata TaxID=166423 RepID=A0A0N0U5Y3_9HYME|nr:Histone-lysine N-methyltransferase SETMAR [Melipona quadrifasciata]